MQAPRGSHSCFSACKHTALVDTLWQNEGNVASTLRKSWQVVCRHNLANLSGIKAAAKIFPGKPQVRPG